MSEIWRRAERSLTEGYNQLGNATTAEQFQVIGIFSREAIISLAQAVYAPSIHETTDGTRPSETDANRMLEAYLNHNLSGKSFKVVRKYAKASLDLAVSLQHKRTATWHDSKMSLDATSSLINLVSILEDRSVEAEARKPNFRIAFTPTQISSDLHTYKLDLALSNDSPHTIDDFKVVIEFPDIGEFPPVWLPLAAEAPDFVPLVEIHPTSPKVSFTRETPTLEVTYAHSEKMFPGESVDLGRAVGLIYRFNDQVYSHRFNYPPIHWRLYIDGREPEEGEARLSDLNIYLK
ncbi:MAG: hypothetical protein PVI78_10070 [Anaerolineales bacterium]